jgi:hypothetical protein
VPRTGTAELLRRRQLPVELPGLLNGTELAEQHAIEQPRIRPRRGAAVFGRERDLMPGVGQ